ncbi:MAG: 16S rRNA (cytosine(1402)-N(4))-methyltransferase RsmH [Acidobacteria bacterium]|nr:16S rRNA (cytosine(1402)-N(4))-methyltransferase RsmH [Acidobacteriota bacterium]
MSLTGLAAARVPMVSTPRVKTGPGEAGDLHRPVMLSQVVEYLRPQSSGVYIDATLGLGSHARAILEKSSPKGKLLGIDRDRQSLDRAARGLAGYEGRLQLHHGNFAEVKDIAGRRRFSSCDGILADLGLSSFQLETAERGFSFQRSGPLDMRMDTDSSLTAAEVVNRFPEPKLAGLIYSFGEEPGSRRIARAIVRARPLHDTLSLAEVVSRAVRSRRRSKIHPATRTFQALRIVVNDELEALRQFVAAAIELLKEGGRLAIISFHSLEDRIVKGSLGSMARGCICPPEMPACACGRKKLVKLVCRKPVSPSEAEKIRNPRSRSARLRVAERL